MAGHGDVTNSTDLAARVRSVGTSKVRRLTVRPARTTVVILAAVALGLSTAGSATAADAAGLKSQATGRCMDDSFAFSLRTFPCNGTNFQKFTFWPLSNGTFFLQNKATGRCIDDHDGKIGPAACNGSRFQQWFLVTLSRGGPRMLVNRATNDCIDNRITGANVLQTIPCNSQALPQRFALQ